MVAVALGTSQQLTCSLACASGTATVRWRGLDTNLGAVWSDPGRSVLWLHGASLADAGTRVCRGSCGSRTFQHSVEVLVYGEHLLPFLGPSGPPTPSLVPLIVCPSPSTSPA